jgi:hypothetical protein
MNKLDEIKARLAASTPGPWEWTVNLEGHAVHIVSATSGRLYVMDFVRWGMSNAQPRFRNADCLMVPVHEVSAVVEGREHHAKWYRTVDHPDAQLIAHAPTDLAALVKAVEEVRAECVAIAAEVPEPDAVVWTRARKALAATMLQRLAPLLTTQERTAPLQGEERGA